ncbi:MAG: helix-turn-helix transcriptional regulator [Fimbriimonas sp.]
MPQLAHDNLPLYTLPTECPLVYRPWALRAELEVARELRPYLANAVMSQVAPPHYHEITHVYHANATVELSYEEDDSASGREARLVVVGPRRAIADRTRGPNNLTIGFRFRVEGFGALTGRSPDEVAERIVPAEEVFGDAARSAIDGAMNAINPEEKAARLQELLVQHPGRRAVDEQAQRCLGAVAALGPRATVAELAREVGYSPRNLDRLFHNHFGTAPKTFLRLFRYWTARRLILRRPDLPIGHVAHAAGFYDEPHLCHEFRAIASITPRALVCVLATDFVSPDECREYASTVGDRPDLPWNLDTPNGRFARTRLRLGTR